ncbi:17598_t:CDS:2, partial [Rhizophagus irregularis]
LTIYHNFLLTILLLDTMKKSVSAKLPGKIVLTSSRANNFGEIDFDNLNLEKGVYLRDMQNTKLMNILICKELGYMLQNDHITTYSLHPDVILTNIAHLNTGFSISTLIINTLSRLNGITAEQGVTNVLVYPAFSLETGKYYDEGIEQEPNKIANNQEIAKKL